MFGLNPTSLVTLLTLAASTLAHPGHNERDGHDHVIQRRLPGTAWYQPDDHPVHALFKRDGNATSTDGQTYPKVGSPEWRAKYPDPKPDPTKLPQAWVDALNAAIQAGDVPNFPPSTPTGGNPTYGDKDPLGKEICSATYKCRNPDDLWDAPDGVFGVSFDDGPIAGSSDTLYDFLKENDTPATHFMIGINILNNAPQFLRAYQELQGDIAVHTWTHPYMTTLTNEQLLGEFGWTMQIIHDSTDGRLPKYWRPPYGDSDNRVRAIAKIFGLTTVIWNQDTEDWSIGSPGGATLPQVEANLQKWISGPKSPGLIILEHELSNSTVSAFINAFPSVKTNGWKVNSLAQLDGQSAYQNADGDDGTVEAVTGVLAYSGPSVTDSASGSASVSGSGAATAAASSGASNVPTASGSGSRSASPSQSGAARAQQANGASLASAFDVRSVFVSLFSLLVSAFALA